MSPAEVTAFCEWYSCQWQDTNKVFLWTVQERISR